MNAANPNLAETKTLLSAMAAEAEDLKGALGGPISDVVAGWLVPHYALAARERLSAAEGAGRLEILRAFVQDLALLRRGDHSAARLQLEREQLDLLRASRQSQKEKEFREWIRRPEIRREFFPDPSRGLSAETVRKIENELHLL